MSTPTTSENPPTCIGTLYDLAPQEDLPSETDIHYWTHGDDDEDDATVHRMIDLPEDAKEPENTEDMKRRLHLYEGVVELLDD